MTEAPRNPHHLERPLKATLSCTQTCNLNCLHCYADCDARHARDEMRAEEWRHLADRLIEDGVMSLFVEGGEPFCRADDLLALLRHCARRMMTRVRTNGTLVTPDLARTLKAGGLGGALVDVMGATAATHDGMTGVPGSFERACAGVTALLDAGIPTEMLLILNRRNVAELDAYMTLAQRLGVRKVGILRLYPIGRAKRHWGDLALSLHEMTAAIGALKPPAGIRLMQSWHPNDGNCCWQMAAVDPFGRSIGCSYLREFVDYGDVREAGILPSWDHPLYRELRAGAVEESCATCAASQGSHGGCRSTAYAFHRRWGAPDPFDATLNHGVDLRVLPDWLLQTGARRPGPAGS
ncbi:MAG: radical SAM/SPASM domain-containing protein [Alphaproteobacteria bacterium]